MKRIRRLKSGKQRHPAISSESGHLEGAWAGHFPVTCVAMMSVLERIAEGAEKFSPAERVLFVACEFWSALNAGELDSYFDLRAEDPTRDARLALRIVGAVQLSTMLDRGVLGSNVGRAVIQRRRRLEHVEARLRNIAEPLDLLLARFAWRYMSTQRRRSATSITRASLSESNQAYLERFG